MCHRARGARWLAAIHCLGHRGLPPLGIAPLVLAAPSQCPQLSPLPALCTTVSEHRPVQCTGPARRGGGRSVSRRRPESLAAAPRGRRVQPAPAPGSGATIHHRALPRKESFLPLAAMGISTTSRRPAMAPAPLEPARRDGHGDSARRPRIARQPTQFSIYCRAAAGAANTTTNDPHDPEGAHGQAEPRHQSVPEIMARSATSGRDILSPMEKRPLSQWGGGLSANPTWSAIQLSLIHI